MSPLSLQYRLSKRLVTGIAALLVIFVATLGALLVQDHSREFDRSLESKARALIDLTQRRVARIYFTDGGLLEMEDGRRSTFFAIRPADGTALSQPSTESPSEVLNNGRSAGAPRFGNVTLPDGAAGRQVEIDFFPLSADPGTTARTEMATVIVAEPRIPQLWKAVRASLTLLGFATVLLVALVLLVRHALRRGLEPVVGLSRQLETLDPTHRGQRVNLQAPPDELAPIMRHINDLIERADRARPSKRTVAR